MRTEKILFFPFLQKVAVLHSLPELAVSASMGELLVSKSSGTTLPCYSSLSGKLSQKPGTRKKFSKHQAKIPNGPDYFQAAFYLPQL